jgi:hypothetical protein
VTISALLNQNQMTFRISEPFYYKDDVVSRNCNGARELVRLTNGQEKAPGTKIEQGSHGALRKTKVLMWRVRS